MPINSPFLDGADLIWTLVSLLLTLMVFSYLFGDNILFRIATYIFVGVTAGYVAVILVYQVLLPGLVWPVISGSFLQAVVPIVLSLLLVTKLFPRLASLGNISMGYVVGIAAAVIIGGAVMGTLFGQGMAAINMFDASAAAASPQGPFVQYLGAAFILVGTVCTLAYFNFGAVSASSSANQPPHRPPMVELLARIGQVFIAITLGAIFAGIFAASITALIERLDFIKTAILSLIP
jgi:hypothetical protein